jgi:hypothetical protein
MIYMQRTQRAGKSSHESNGRWQYRSMQAAHLREMSMGNRISRPLRLIPARMVEKAKADVPRLGFIRLIGRRAEV